MNYNVENNEAAISQAIYELTRIDQKIHIQQMKDMANKKVVLFSLGSQTGLAMFERGSNDKWMIETAGLGNTFHLTVADTSDGQYIVCAGDNADHMSRIVAYVEEDSYELDIEPGEYFIVSSPLQEKTEYDMPTGAIGYNDKNEEVFRTGGPAETAR
ncbi:hypothetical protein ACFOHW_22770 [Paenibacillus abyssi]